ncbi:CesT family type III secretion system chaperone [Noviherbaspirillum sp. CPCC 100848]|uniref:CesT family type III secretion system chaperone n=1 Tax=Noviherbaspirillum album TaxID=3080276 RepID=A0ABU6JB40_9BURK|nr:CesT family type III secretion system chaperone [Noviherbaspirillum sp. CPCC 100848]MEC4720750.1 CesT family type III secretion system chaperone [Noviherbaspirillum sp. CPCC 100848]
MQSRFEALLREFAAHVGMEDASALVSSGEIVVDKLSISILYEDEISSDNVVCVAQLGMPAEPGAGIYRTLLEANLMWAGTGGATLGLHPDTGQVCIAYKQPLDTLDGEGLGEVIDQFADIAAYWRDEISRITVQPVTHHFPNDLA